MTNNLDARKFRLIELIMQLNAKQAVARLEKVTEKVNKKDSFWAAIKPLKKSCFSRRND